MSDPQLAAYLVFTTLLVVTPGSATAVVVRNVLDGGRRQGMATAAGLAVANSTYAVSSAFGLAAVFARSPRALVALSAAGAAYLAFLGLRSLVTAWRDRAPAMAVASRGAAATAAAGAVAAAPSHDGRRAAAGRPGGESAADRPGSLATATGGVLTGLSQGVLANLLSPVIATFYLAVVPSFLGGAPLPSPRYALFAALHVAMAFAYHSAWVLALHAMRGFWSRRAARRALEALAGLALLLLAARVAGAL